MKGPGFLFMFGIYGTKATRETVALLKSTGAASVLLLGRNIETPSQTRRLCSELVQKVGRPLLFAIDHEGGWVLRFKSGLTAFPGNAALGRANDPKLAHATGEFMGRELLALGIQLNLAPALDVLTPRYNPGIGIRSFGSDPMLVASLGAAFIRGMQGGGVAACAKHFPGAGAARVDPHVALPTIEIPPRELRTHLAPFSAAVRAGVACVMTSHVRYPALDREIATFSRKITHNLLRGRLGFRGVVISDDLCMGAVSADMPVQLAAVKAIQAGHDLLIIAHDKAAMSESAELLEQSVADRLISRSEIAASASRIERLLAMKRPFTSRPDLKAAEAVALDTARKAVLLDRREVPLPFNPDLVVFPDFKEVEARFTFEGGAGGPLAWLKKRVQAKIVLAPVEKTELGNLPRMVRRARTVLFFCFEATRFPGQKAALELLRREAAAKTVACLIRSSWDANLLDRRTTIVDTGGYRLCQLGAALEKMLG